MRVSSSAASDTAAIDRHSRAGRQCALVRLVDLCAFTALLQDVRPFGGAFSAAPFFVLSDLLAPTLREAEKRLAQRQW
ncbi:hypothetical protein [Streptomyces sp. PA5.6]|uniref:hypothetical protein n=1 Tax=Streptomyces sp. PA5.6 TaxID=3035651 RepID=UPI00390481EC